MTAMPEAGPNRWTNPAVILVATDLSDLDRLMPFAIEQGSQTDARLIMLHVLSTAEFIAADATGMPYYDPSTAVETASRTLETWCNSARKRSVRCDALVREGNAAQQIFSAARQFQADRILLGTRSRSKFSKLLIGSVAEQVLRSVNIPVITVGPEAHLQVVKQQPEAVVLHATTLREASRPSAALACKIAAGSGAKLILLHVMPHLAEMTQAGLAGGMESEAGLNLAALAESTAQRCSAAVEPIIAHGNPAIEILSAASDRKAALIVMGCTQRSALENLTRDRTIYKVLAHARCPVMTLREQAASTPDAQPEILVSQEK